MTTAQPTPAAATRPVRYWPALDGIRGYGVVIIFFYHWASRYPRGGWLSVDLFFVLSGFLITTLLIGEWDKRQRIDFKAFYARRALRLFPALASVLVACVLAVVFIPELRFVRHYTLHAVPFVVFYCGNWLRASSTYGGNAGLFVHTWSLALEEQFYLVCPVVLWLILRRAARRDLVALGLVVAAVAEMAYRMALVLHGATLSRIYNATDTHSDGLLLGAALAFFLASGIAERGRWAQVERHLLRPMTVISAALLAFLLCWTDYLRLRVMAVAIPLTNVTTAILVWNLVRQPIPALRAALGNRLAVWLGRRSYGLYLWQFPIIVATYFFPPHNVAEQVARDVVRVVLTFGVAGLSYRFYEQRFLRRKKRFQVTEAMPAGIGDLSAGTVGAAAPRPSVAE